MLDEHGGTGWSSDNSVATVSGGVLVGWTWLKRAQLGVVAAGLFALTATTGVQPAQAFPPDQVERGAAVWNNVCAQCHGPDSTNEDAPLLLRPDSLRRFPHAAAAFKYVSESMPSETPGSLTQEEYWDVLAFLLANNGVSEGDSPLGPDTAAGVPTRAGAARPAGAGAPSAGGEPAETPQGEEAPKP
jgi:mono/diheme cytochrome c family protein